MTDQPLSPAAAAVLAAYHKEAIDYIESWGSFSHKRGMAAAMRAAADQMGSYQSKKFLYSIADAMKLQDIAAELEQS